MNTLRYLIVIVNFAVFPHFSFPNIINDEAIHFKIEGTITGYEGSIYLMYEDNYKKSNKIISEVKNGKFIISGFKQVPVLVKLHLDGASLIEEFYIDNNYTKIECSSILRIRGNDTMNIFKVDKIRNSKLESKKKKFHTYLSKLEHNVNLSAQDRNIKYYQLIKNYIQEHPKSKLGCYLLSDLKMINSSAKFNYHQVNVLFQLLDTSLQNSYEGKMAKLTINKLDRSEYLKPGNKIFDFASKDTSNNIIRYNDFKGKYLLIVCWASWCGPCRKEHPFLNNLYAKYKNFGFELVGISFDVSKDKEKWIRAIDNDKLQWLQISDLLGFENSFALYYNIDRIPFNILVDREGNIIGSDYSDTELLTTINELFNTSLEKSIL